MALSSSRLNLSINREFMIMLDILTCISCELWLKCMVSSFSENAISLLLKIAIDSLSFNLSINCNKSLSIYSILGWINILPEFISYFYSSTDLSVYELMILFSSLSEDFEC